MTVYTTDPLRDSRWLEFLERHPRASVFHTPGWLEALRRTYGYQPVVLTTSPPTSELSNGIVFCRISSWLTGRRMVSLPFTDHCEPLVDSKDNLNVLLSFLVRDLEREHWKYIEFRPLMSPDFDPEIQPCFGKSESFYFHKLGLQSNLDTLFQNFHRSCIQRKIRRAERERLTYEKGCSQSILGKFYYLLLITRRRHQLPPQPWSWFRNLVDCLGDRLTIRVVSRNGQPMASILTLSGKNSLVYKYGCSDARFHNLGGMSFLFWQTIQEGKEQGAQEFDLGRSATNNDGLIAFKNHWGAVSSPLSYYRFPLGASPNFATGWKMQVVRQVCARLPDSILTTASKLLYRHVG